MSIFYIQKMPEYSLSKPFQTYLYPTGSNEEPKDYINTHIQIESLFFIEM